MTANRILDIAEELFLERGYSAVSIRDIAAKAKVPISLIYHYFESKEFLWKSVKSRILGKYTDFERREEIQEEDFKTYLKKYLSFRFDFYNQSPHIARLIAWQRLESQVDALSGVAAPTTMLNVEERLKAYQRKGEIRRDIDPALVAYLMMNTVTLPYFDQSEFLEESSVREQFIHTVVEMFEKYVSC